MDSPASTLSPPHQARDVSEAIGRFLAEPLDLASLELIEVIVPQVEGFRSALGVRNERRALLARVREGSGAWGIGECSCRPDPWFNGEFVEGSRAVLRDFVAPLLPGVDSVGSLLTAVERVRSWPFTRAVLLDAVADLVRRRSGRDLLDGWSGQRVDRVPVGISLGLFPSPEAAVDRVARAVTDGYHRVKLKISPTMDFEPLAEVRRSFPEVHLGFDANGSCGDEDLPFLERLASLGPTTLEQPFAPDRLDLAAELRRRELGFRLCLDESVSSLGQLRSAVGLGALDELNLKPGRVGGPVETFRILAEAQGLGLPVWVGGMFETGIGRFANLRVARRLPSAQAHDLSPSSRYFTVDLLERPLEMDAQGTIDLGGEAPPALDDGILQELTQHHERLDLTV